MNILDAFAIYSRIKAAEAAIKAAAPGEEVDAGPVRGLKIGGRLVDLPLKPVVRR